MGKVLYVGSCGLSETGEHSSNLFQLSEISCYSDGLCFIKKLYFFLFKFAIFFPFFSCTVFYYGIPWGKFLFWLYLIGVLCVPCLGLSLVRKVLFYDLVKDLIYAETGILPIYAYNSRIWSFDGVPHFLHVPFLSF